MKRDLGTVEHELLNLRAVIDDCAHGALNTHQQLLTNAVRVGAAHVCGRDVEDGEEALRQERQVVAEIGGDQAAT